jgi:hypothetical protein
MEESESRKAIAIREAIFHGARTKSDGGWLVTFDLPEQAANQIAQLNAVRDSILSIAVVPDDILEN